MKKVIGLTGTIGAGKYLIKEILLKRFNCWYVSLSSILRNEMKRKKSNDRNTLQNLGNELRQKYGNHILAKIAVEYLQRDKELLIVDGIRNPGEVEFLRKRFGKDFILIAVDAPPEQRFERVKQRGSERDPSTWEEFVTMDERDQGKDEPEYGQQVKKCLEQADFTIINNDSPEQLESKVIEVMNKVMS